MDNKIDFVVLWVDGSDPEWVEEKNSYVPGDTTPEIEAARFRDWDNMKYWFRGIEKFAPWVNKIHFVTYGHLPSFLNTENKKLNIVNHKDIIDSAYLPTFNSAAIEVNISKIAGLTDKFVYFNDDTFIMSPMKERDFFVNLINLLCFTHLNNLSPRGSNKQAILLRLREVGRFVHGPSANDNLQLGLRSV